MNYKRAKDFIVKNLKYGFVFERELRRVKFLHSLDKSQLLEMKNKKFVQQYRNAYLNSHFYNNLYRHHGLTLSSVKSLSDIEKLPIISRKDIQHKVEDLLTTKRIFVYEAFTSGTSGSPLKIYRDYVSACREHAYLHYFQQLHGYELGDPVLSLRSFHDKKRLSYLDKSNNILHLSSFHINSDRINEYYQLIKDFKPKVLKSYPGSMHILATELYKAGKEIQIPITFSASETLHDFQKKNIEKVMNTKIYDCYGNAERTVAFGQYNGSLYREFPLYSHVEVKSDHLITSSFINSSFPLIRYKVNDVLKLSKRRDMDKIEKIMGRSNDYVLMEKGQKVSNLELAFKEVEHLCAAQIVQKQIGCLNVNIVPDKNFSEKNRQHLEQNLRNYLGDKCRIRFDIIDTNQLILTKKSKFKFVVSQLDKTKVG